MDNPVAKALHDGLDHLRERGLAKGALCDDEGRVCARGAVLRLTSRDEAFFGTFRRTSQALFYAADDLLAAAADEQYPERTHGSVPYFNNHPDTTQEDVERIFEKAIVKAYETL